MNWLAEKFSGIKDIASDKVLSKLSEIFRKVMSDTLLITDQFFEIFVVAAIIGIFFTMTGNKKLGTKITSISFLLYLVVRVVCSVYV